MELNCPFEIVTMFVLTVIKSSKKKQFQLDNFQLFLHFHIQIEMIKLFDVAEEG